MTTKTVLITGASSGFGRDLAPAFLKAGWTVLATMRNASGRAELFNDDLAKWPDRLFVSSLDVADERERAAIAEFIDAKFDSKLDCLVNNAGYGVFGALEDLSEEQIRRQMEVNFFGLVVLTQRLLPQIRNAGGRVINISSVLGYLGMPLSSLYCASKFAVEGLSEALYYELRPHGVQVALVEPGAYRTEFSTNQIYGERTEDDNSKYRNQFKSFKRYRQRRSSGPGKSISSVIEAVVKLAEADRMPMRVRCGKDAKLAYLVKRLFPSSIQRAIMSKTYDNMFSSREEQSGSASM